jgi:hypothetical protein
MANQFNLNKGIFYLMLFLIIFLGVCLIFVLAKKPMVLVEYRNQSCELLVDNGWTKDYKPIYSNWTIDFGEQYGYDKVPDNYTLIQVYEEVCSEGMGCKYFKRNVYIKKVKI